MDSVFAVCLWRQKSRSTTMRTAIVLHYGLLTVLRGWRVKGRRWQRKGEGRLKEAKIGDNDEELAIASLEVSSEVVDALAKRGITQLFPIQKAVLEPSMTGRDQIARAKTGTGKTLAFKTNTSCHQNGSASMKLPVLM